MLLGIIDESQDSVMQIMPTKLSSAICCISSTNYMNKNKEKIRAQNKGIYGCFVVAVKL